MFVGLYVYYVVMQIIKHFHSSTIYCDYFYCN